MASLGYLGPRTAQKSQEKAKNPLNGALVALAGLLLLLGWHPAWFWCQSARGVALSAAP
jgi:hypothetical protein